MNDLIDEYEKSFKKSSWTVTLIKVAIAVILVIWVYYSVLPIKEQVAYYNTFLQVGQCLCPQNSSYNDYFNLRNVT